MYCLPVFLLFLQVLGQGEEDGEEREGVTHLVLSQSDFSIFCRGRCSNVGFTGVEGRWRVYRRPPQGMFTWISFRGFLLLALVLLVPVPLSGLSRGLIISE